MQKAGEPENDAGFLMHVASISINKYMQKAGEPENDAGFFRVIIIAAVYVASSTIIIHTLLSLE